MGDGPILTDLPRICLLLAEWKRTVNAALALLLLFT